MAELTIVDAHVHWRDPATNPYELLSDSVSEDGGRNGSPADIYLPIDFKEDAAGLKLVGAVHIEAEWDHGDPVGETRWLHEVARSETIEHVPPFVVVGHADLSRSDAPDILAGHAAYPLTRGIRHMLNFLEGRPDLCWADREYLDDPLWRENYGRLADHGLHFDLMCFAHQLPAFAALAERHPNIPVHLEHAALPWDHTLDGRRRWREGMGALAALPHADVKISGLGNTVPGWSVDAICDYVLETVDLFGTDRVSFASNFPTDKPFGSMVAHWRAYDRITRGFSTIEREAMFCNNALRSYRFPIPDAG